MRELFGLEVVLLFLSSLCVILCAECSRYYVLFYVQSALNFMCIV